MSEKPRTATKKERDLLTKTRSQGQPNSGTDTTIAVTTEAQAPSWDRFGGAAEEFPALAAEYLALNQEANRITARKKEIADKVKGVLAEVQEKAIRGDFFLAQRVTSHKSKKISPYKMLECGIEQEVIDYCYEGGEAYEYVTITVAVGE